MDELTLRDAMYEHLDASQEDDDAFEINSVEAMTWYAGHIERLMGHIARQRKIADKKMDALKRAYDAEAEKIEGDFLRESSSFRNQIRSLTFKYGAQANQFAKSHIATLKAKSFNVGQFRFGLRNKPPTLRVLDKSAAIEWLYQNGLDSVVRVEESVNMSELSNKFMSSSDLPNGVERTREDEVFYIKLSNQDVTEELTGENDIEPDRNNLQ